jgi:hypothetical protein
LSLAIRIAVAIVAATACIGPARAQSDNTAQTYGDEMRQSLQRGNEIFQRERAVELATAAVTPERLASMQVIGWLVERARAAWQVRFVQACDTGLCVRFDIGVDLDAGTAVVAELASAEPLTSTQAAGWRARQTALAAGFEACADRYDAVVVPAADPNGTPVWLVYLIPYSGDPTAIHLTGYHRITVSADGRNVLRNEPLANSCLTMDRNADAKAIVVTHIMHPFPIETHVYIALRYGLPVIVTTGATQYLVDGNRIVVLDPNR